MDGRPGDCRLRSRARSYRCTHLSPCPGLPERSKATGAWLAVSHFTGWRLAVSALLAIGMFLSFTLAVGLNLRRGRRLPCHCFGGRDQELISGQTLVRLALLLICEVFVLNGSGMLASSRPSDLHVLHGPGLDVILFWGPFLLIGGSWLLSLPNVVYLLCPYIPEKGSGGGSSNE